MRMLALLFLLTGLAIGQHESLSWASSSSNGAITGASASCTGGSCVYWVTPSNTTAAVIQLTGTFSATVQFESSVAGVTFASLASTTGATSATAPGIYSFQLSGQRFIHVRSSSYTSGTVKVDISASTAQAIGSAVLCTSDVTTNCAINANGSGNVAIGSTVLRGGGTALPATCSVGDQYFLTTGTTGNYNCTASNTWTLPGTSRSVTCVTVIGDPGAASAALANDNDSPAACGNSFGSDWTITSVSCYANAGSPTVTPILTGGSGTSILTGALTCGTAGWAGGTVQATAPVVHAFSANGATCSATPCTVDVDITTAGGTAKYIVVRITGTL